MPDRLPPHQELEIKLAFLERTVEGLNAAIVEQSQVLERLVRRCEKLERDAKAASAGGRDDVGPQHDPPPHY